MEWENFAREIWSDNAGVTVEELRDDAEAILQGVVADMASSQTEPERKRKSQGDSEASDEPSGMDRASERHGSGRVESGFDMAAVMAEYRALRASIIRLWRDSKPKLHEGDLEDLTRLNEAIDQSLTHAVDAFVAEQREREADAGRQRDLRTEAEAANRAKELFLATLSHELRTPLNAIIGWMSILRGKDCDEKDLAEGLEVIDRSSRAQARLIDDVLDISRIHSGKLQIRRGRCDLAEVILDGVEAVRPAAEARGIAIDVRLDADAAEAHCDHARIRQVIWNLVSNAVKFTPVGGKVQVTLTCVDSSRHIQVSDTGQGIDPQVLPHIFDRFRQADSSTRRKFPGLGLGLSIVKYLVEAHGGTVEAASPGPGKGATFTVVLPNQSACADEDEAAQAQAEAPGGVAVAPDDDASCECRPPLTRLDGLNLLVVDDEPGARRVLALILRRLGAHVTTAAGAAEALAVLPGLKPDVLISDIGMPGMDGLDLIRETRRGHGRDLPAIALTAFAHQEDARRILAAGYDVHLAKPLDPATLTATIAQWVRRG